MADTEPDPMPASAPKGILLKADTIAEPFLADVKASLANVSRLRVPKLVGILATTNVPSRSYAEFTRRQCVALGIEFELREVGPALSGANESSADGDGVEEAIIEANVDDTVNGIMVRVLVLAVIELSLLTMLQVYYPIFGKEQVSRLLDHLRPSIVDLSFTRDLRTTICSKSFRRSRMSRDSTLNFTTISITSLSLSAHLRPWSDTYGPPTSIRYLEPKSLLGLSPPVADSHAPLKDDVPPPGTVKSILPCTPLGVVKCLERVGVYNALLPYGDRAYGRTITVINRCVSLPRGHRWDDPGPPPDRKSSDAR
jgi:methylenetetrahydrofolate dehydrogenase (NAD+)